MAHSWLRVALVLVFSALPLCAQDGKPELSKTPLTAEQVAVYRTFLATYNNGSGSTLNLGDRTTPFNFSSPREDPYAGRCLEGITLAHAEDAVKVVHRIKPGMFDGNTVRLVDAEKQHRIIREHDPHFRAGQERPLEEAVGDAFASGLLQLSEIVFDPNHQYAVMSFSFVCGGLCGHGGVIVFQKVDGAWKQLHRECVAWVS